MNNIDFAWGACLLALVFSMPALAQEQTEAPAPTFAGGASAITEVHGNWTVLCGFEEADKVCVVTQNLADSQSGQRMLTLELELAGDGGAEGVAMIPFGLRLPDGIGMQADAVNVGDRLPIVACYDNGCLATFTLDDAGIELLRRGNTLRLAGTVQDSGENVVLSMPLAGITSAMARGRQLLSQ